MYELELKHYPSRNKWKEQLKFKLNESIETKFIREEVKKQNVSSFDKLNQNAKSVCRVFMEVLHSDLYRRDKNKSKEELRREFEVKYFNEIIKTV